MEQEIASLTAQLIQQVGFPIAVAFWLLARTDKRIEQMTTVLQEIAKTMAVIKEKINGDGE